MKKINWINVSKLVMFLISIGVILHDLYMVTLHGYITGHQYGWTWLGFGTFILFCMIAGLIYEDFEEQIKSTPRSRQTLRKGTSK